MRLPPCSRTGFWAAVVAAAFSSVCSSHAALVEYKITSDLGDGEVRQSSASATFGNYTTNTGTTPQWLRVGFQSSFGSDGQLVGGLNAVWFFKLPKLNLAAGDSIASVDFVTTLMEESASSTITPRFNADLYALGFVTSPTLVGDGTFFFAGQDQSGPGLGSGQMIQKVDDDYFTIFTDWQAVNANGGDKKPKPIFTDADGRLNLAAYIQGIYDNPAFPNTGNEYLVLRLSADRAPNEMYEENGTQFYGKGTTRYRVASGDSATMTPLAGVDYSEVIPPRLTLNVNQTAVPEPATFALLGLGGLWLGARRSRGSAGILTRWDAATRAKSG